MKSRLYDKLTPISSGKIAVLVDPDKQTPSELLDLVEAAVRCRVDFFFVGGSLLLENNLSATVKTIKAHCTIPVILFPGNNYQLCEEADAILLLSLISGRNPYYLIESQIEAAPQIKKMNLEVISTSYLLIDGGTKTTVERVSKTIPLNASNSELIYNTTLAGNFIGHQAIYLDTGSGANNTVPAEIVELISTLNSIIIVGGGIRKIDQIKKL
jgi:putative glycerol-1-phosphate prenyltransferase